MSGRSSLGPGSDRAMLLLSITSHALEVFHLPAGRSDFARSIALCSVWTVSEAGS